MASGQALDMSGPRTTTNITAQCPSSVHVLEGRWRDLFGYSRWKKVSHGKQISWHKEVNRYSRGKSKLHSKKITEKPTISENARKNAGTPAERIGWGIRPEGYEASINDRFAILIGG